MGRELFKATQVKTPEVWRHKRAEVRRKPDKSARSPRGEHGGKLEKRLHENSRKSPYLRPWAWATCYSVTKCSMAVIPTCPTGLPGELESTLQAVKSCAHGDGTRAQQEGDFGIIIMGPTDGSSRCVQGTALTTNLCDRYLTPHPTDRKHWVK